MKIATCIMMVLVVTASFTLNGCKEPKGAWNAEETKKLTARKKARMEQLQKDEGMTYTESMRQWDLERSIEKWDDYRRPSVVLDGDKLQDVLSE